MKFLRYLNPFFIARTIRELRGKLAFANEQNATLRSSRDDWRTLANNAIAESKQLRRIADVQDQAIEANMAERAELKDEIAGTDRAGLYMTGKYIEASFAATLATLAIGRVRQLEAEAGEQARETLEVISYVKQVETALAAGGITIEDEGLLGPVIVVNQDVFLQRLGERTFKVVREQPAAA